MYDIPKFLKRDGEALLFNTSGELIYYVPEVYFEKGIAEVIGEIVSLLGVFDYAIFDENGKSSGLKPLIFLQYSYVAHIQLRNKKIYN